MQMWLYDNSVQICVSLLRLPKTLHGLINNGQFIIATFIKTMCQND